MNGDVQGTNEVVVDGDGEEGPPHHSFVDVDPPGENDISCEGCVSSSFQNYIVVVLSVWG